MSEPKKPATKRIIDVAHPGESAPSSTSKPVLITNRPILKDPMMVKETDTEKPEKLSRQTDQKIEPLSPPPLTETDEETEEAAEPAPSKLKVTGNKAISTPEIAELPAEEATDKPDTAKPAPEAAEVKELPDTTDEEADKPAPEPDAARATAKADDQSASSETDTPVKQTPEEVDADAAKQAEHEAAVQKLVDGKAYFLPINAVEKRRTKRFVILGVILSLVLAVAWADIALDAGIIHLHGVKPATHFFSN